MPDKDGIELIEWLAIQKCVAPIILISGYGGKYLDMTSHVASVQGIVIAGTLTKPFELGDLEMLLKQVIDAFET